MLRNRDRQDGLATPAGRPAPRTGQGAAHRHHDRRRAPGDVQPGGAQARAGQRVRRDRHPRPERLAGAVHARQGRARSPWSCSSTPTSARRGRADAHCADRRSAGQCSRRRGRRRCCCSPSAGSSSAASWSRPASGSPCSSATARRCASTHVGAAAGVRRRHHSRSARGCSSVRRRSRPPSSAVSERPLRCCRARPHRPRTSCARATRSADSPPAISATRPPGARSPRANAIVDPLALTPGAHPGHPGRGAATGVSRERAFVRAAVRGPAVRGDAGRRPGRPGA